MQKKKKKSCRNFKVGVLELNKHLAHIRIQKAQESAACGRILCGRLGRGRGSGTKCFRLHRRSRRGVTNVPVCPGLRVPYDMGLSVLELGKPQANQDQRSL